MAASRWEFVKNTLTAETGREFERKALPFLRIEWPDLAYPSDLGFLDCNGIDQAVVTPGSPFPVVIQFKGFEIQSNLGASQLSQIKASVQSFLNSNITCDTYYLLYNRRGTDRDFEQKAKNIVDALTKAAVAKTAQVWNVDDVVKFIEASLGRTVKNAIVNLSREKARVHRERFLLGDILIEDVPFKEAIWSFKKSQTPVLGSFTEPVNPVIRAKVAAIAPGIRWTLLVGPFGIGKSTLAVSLGNKADKSVIYVPASELRHHDSGGGSENALAAQIATYLAIFDDALGIQDLDPQLLLKLVALCIAKLIRNPDSNVILIIDGLDENRNYSSINGLKLLANELSHAAVPVILTTRKEHFLNAYGNYEGDLSELAWYGSGRDVRVIELTEWNPQLASQFLQNAGEKENGSFKNLLAPLKEKVDNASLPLISSHPLWLTMAAELALENDTYDFENLVDLYEHWTTAKLKRDFRKPRAIPEGYGDNIDILVGNQHQLMRTVAIKMTYIMDGVLMLSESAEESVILSFAKDIYGGGRISSDLYAVTSLMEPTGRRSALQNPPLRFFHTSIHEFYIAWHLALHPDNGFKISVGIQRFLVDA